MADMFLKLDGIQGESLDEKHANEIEITDWTWELDNPASYSMSDSTASSKVDVQNIKITKLSDKSTINLARYCALGTYIPSGKITCRKNAGDAGSKNAGEGKVEYLTISLTHVLVHTVNWQGIGAEQIIHELVTLSFGEFTIDYQVQVESGGGVSGGHGFGYSIKTHKEIQ